ncbi:MAG: hypothetical protein AAGM33_02420, partial [Pseudomonadota bacterium]
TGVHGFAIRCVTTPPSGRRGGAIASLSAQCQPCISADDALIIRPGPASTRPKWSNLLIFTAICLGDAANWR